MRTAWAVFILACLFCGTAVRADDSLQPESRFPSIAAFVAAVEALKPSASTGYFTYLFSTPEMGQPEDPLTGTICRPESITSCVNVWSDDQYALVFAMASSPTQATHSCVGVLFLLANYEKQWRMVDHVKFTAIGKFANLGCVLSSYGAHARPPTLDDLVVTVAEHSGGEGAGDDRSRSYQPRGWKIVPAEMQ